jgi:hypothetical protein
MISHTKFKGRGVFNIPRAYHGYRFLKTSVSLPAQEGRDRVEMIVILSRSGLLRQTSVLVELAAPWSVQLRILAGHPARLGRCLAQLRLARLCRLQAARQAPLPCGATGRSSGA